MTYPYNRRSLPEAFDRNLETMFKDFYSYKDSEVYNYHVARWFLKLLNGMKVNANASALNDINLLMGKIKRHGYSKGWTF